MNERIFEQALRAKDPRFDGRFFIGVRTTGIYCRPVCPVKSPKLANVCYFPTAAAAAEAGFRPCLRCRPESSPGTPAWAGTSATVQRALRLIGEGALDEAGVEALSERLGVTSRHLSRLFMRHLGASPLAVAQTRRLHFAKNLLNETDLPMTEIALAAGYGSVRRFNDHVRQVYGRPPTALRGRAAARPDATLALRLPFRPPYDLDAMLEFLAARAIPGVERVEAHRYWRTIRVDEHCGTIAVERLPGENALRCEIDLPGSRALMRVVDRVRRMFDLNADPLEIERTLSCDPQLSAAIARQPGLRVAGAWDPFEIAVRAIAGQQISVKGATGVMGRIARQFGAMSDGRLYFPAPESLAGLNLGDLPMPTARARAIRDLARAVLEGRVDFATPDPARLVEQLKRLPGIGDWTAQYVAMRAANDPDAFLHSDLVLRRVAKERFGIETGQALQAQSESWRPWRAYAGMYLWRMAH